MISELPNGWTLKSIKEICSEISDGNYSSKYPKQSEFLDSGIPFIRANNLVNNTVIWEDMRFISKEKHELLKKGHLKENDVLITTRGVLGNVALVPKEFDDVNINAQIVRMKTDETIIIPKYLLLTFKSKEFKSQLVKKTTGTTLKQLPVRKLEKMLIVVPPINYQKKIVEILEKAEKLKEWRAEADELAYDYLKSVFINMFGHPLSKENTLAKVKLGDVIDIIVPTRDKPKSFTGTIPWVTLPDLKNSFYINNSKYKLSKKEAKPTKTRLFPKKTVLLSCAGSIGKVAIAECELYTNQQFYGLVCNEKKIIPEFLAYQLSFLGANFYKSIGGTSTLSFFKKDAALKINIILPDLKHQLKFTSLCNQIETLKTHQSQSKQEIDNLFNTLMQKAFKGELIC
ncbi:MAG: restriction endonuclease subunit S [Methanobacteriales archaeon HGW-Methanobacteriales-1]|jgi:type I restriction enzyme S subunit|nr:MAG: restriction endonuclease subunit S [Methanobacteriales archaeon HGW-Methanobacteriales-1]